MKFCSRIICKSLVWSCLLASSFGGLEASPFCGPLLYALAEHGGASSSANYRVSEQDLSRFFADLPVPQEVVDKFAGDDGSLGIMGKQDPFVAFQTRTGEHFEMLLEHIFEVQGIREESEREFYRDQLRAIGLRKFDGKQARAGFKQPKIRILRALELIGALMGYNSPLVSQKKFRQFLRKIGLPSIDQRTQAEFVGRRGVLAILGMQDSFGSFPASTKEYFEKLLEHVFAINEITSERDKEAFRDRLRRIGLRKIDGNSARSGNGPSQVRILQALDLIAEVAERGPLHLRANFVEFLKQMGVPYIEHTRLTQFADFADGSLDFIGRDDSLGSFTDRADEYFQKFLELLFQIENVDDSTRKIYRKKLAGIGLIESDGPNARKGTGSASVRVLQALDLLAEVAGLDYSLETRESYQEFMRRVEDLMSNIDGSGN